MNRFFFRCPSCFLKFTADVEGVRRPSVVECPVCTSRHLKCLGSTKGVVRMDVPCNDKCVFAEGPDCSCSCGGANHGSKLLVPVVSGVVDFSGKGPSWLVETAIKKHRWWTAEMAAIEVGRPEHVKAAFAAGRTGSDEQRRLIRDWQDWRSALQLGCESWQGREKKLKAFRAAYPGAGSSVLVPVGPSLNIGAAASLVLAASTFVQSDLFKF